MDRRFLLIVIILLVSYMANAKVNVGIEVMPQWSNRLSWSTGVNLELPLTDQLYLSPGLFYSYRQKYDESSWETYEAHPDGDVPIHYEKASINIRAHYLNIPFLIGYKAYEGSGYTVKVSGGLYYALCLGGKSRLNMDDNGDVSHMLMPSYMAVIDKRGDFGLCVEAKCLLHKHYQIGINLQHGLRKIYQGFDVQGIRDPLMFHHLSTGVRFHQSIGLSVGYLF